jgi:alpha-ribazole phosphatase
MSLIIHFVRHGETLESREHVFCGSSECALTEAGHRMAALIADRCARGGDWRAVYSSPLSRALDSARPAAARLGLPLTVEDGLREISHGAWEGLTAAQARAVDADAFDGWDDHPGLVAAPQGESGYDVAARALPVISRIRDLYDEGDVLVVSHKGTIRVVVCALLGIDVDLYRARLAQPVATFTIVELTARGVLLRALADSSHLPAEARRGGGV